MEGVTEGNLKRFVIEVLLVPENNNTDFLAEDDGQYCEEKLDTSFQSETHLSDIENTEYKIYDNVSKLDNSPLKFPKEEILSDSKDTEKANDYIMSISNNCQSAASSSNTDDREFNLKSEVNDSDDCSTIATVQNAKKNYTCAVCNISFASRSAFKLHRKSYSKKKQLMNNSSNEQYKCNICNFVTMHKSDLSKHIDNNHRKYDIYVCNICQHTYTNEIYYAKHMSLHSAVNSKIKNTKSMKTHSINKRNKFKCNLCKYSSNHPNGFAKHKRLHLKGDPVHKCNVCHYITDDLHHFQEHLRRYLRNEQDECDAGDQSASRTKQSDEAVQVDSPDKLYKCSKCRYRSDFKDTFAKHIELHLKGGLLHKCTICHYITDDKQHFENHIQAHLRYEMPKLDDTLIENSCLTEPAVKSKKNAYKCDICKYACSNRVSFAKHMELHSKGGGQYKCAICHYITDVWSHYTRHMEKAHAQYSKASCQSDKQKQSNEKLFKCNICNLSYMTPLNYAKHISLHSAENQIKHTCTRCNYFTNDKKNLNKHIKLHCKTNKKNKYKCSFCKYSCLCKISFDKHMELHSKGGGQYKCDICHYITDVRHHYTRHMTRIHPTETF